MSSVTVQRVRHALVHAAAAACMSCVVASHAEAQPNAVHPALASIIAAMPAGSWAHVNTTPLSSVWTPAELRPLAIGSDNPPPSKVLQPWSSVGYDSRRGDILSYGGGHANYAGNDTYRWRSSTLRWERMSYPSEVQYAPSNPFLTMAIDGADNAPPSAHTYDNNIFLPLTNRLLVWGGAAFNTGSGFFKPDIAPNTYRLTGPYFFDPAKADPDKVGGTTGSNVKRVPPFLQIPGGQMWQNRDLPSHLGAQQMPLFLNGCTGLSQENGHDVVYVVGTENGSSQQNVYRYEVVNPANPAQDLFTKVGIYWNGVNGQTTCGYDPVQKLFVRTGTDPAKPFGYWDLTSPGTGNLDATVANNASITAFTNWLSTNRIAISTCALEYDPVRRNFPVWCGNGVVWVLKAPAVNGPTGWTITQQPAPVGVVPALDPLIFGGVLGKWRYMPGYDVFAAVASIEGDIWVYKPASGWVAPSAIDQPPTVSIVSPSPNASLTLNQPVTITASPVDPDGSVTLVRFYVNGTAIGDDTTGPWTATWTPTVAGTYSLAAVATDNQGASGPYAAIAVNVGTGPLNQPPMVDITAPSAGASYPAGTAIMVTANATDPDGVVASVQFLANGIPIGTDSSGPPWSVTWTPATPGAYSLGATATDDDGSTDVAPAVPLTITAAPPPTTRKLRDFDASGKSDLLWRNSTTGDHALWLMNGGALVDWSSFVPDPGWQVTHTAFFDADNRADILWRNASTGAVVMWLMNGKVATSIVQLFADPQWSVTAVGDFNGDGNADLLWTHSGTKEVAMWLMNGSTFIGGGTLLRDPAWRVTHVADFNGDGRSDILWRNDSTGETRMWLMNGSSVIGIGTIFVDTAWSVTHVGDLSGDGKADLVWRRTTGETTAWVMNGISLLSWAPLLNNAAWTVQALADLDGDHRADIIWRNAGTGDLAAWLMNGAALSSGGRLLLDPDWSYVTSGDYNGDGKADLILHNKTTSETVVWLMNGLAPSSWSSLLKDAHWDVTP